MSIRSRIVRGFGYGAKILSMLGLGNASEATQVYTGGGQSLWDIRLENQKRKQDTIEADDEEILMAIQMFLTMREAA
jgi:hypothetical protein